MAPQPLSPWRQRKELEEKRDEHYDSVLAKRSEVAPTNADARTSATVEATKSRKVPFGVRFVNTTQCMLAMGSISVVLVAWLMHVDNNFQLPGSLGKNICIHLSQYVTNRPTSSSEVSCRHMPGDSLNVTLILAASSAAVIAAGGLTVFLAITLMNSVYSSWRRRSSPEDTSVLDSALHNSAASTAAAATSPPVGLDTPEVSVIETMPSRGASHSENVPPVRTDFGAHADKGTYSRDSHGFSHYNEDDEDGEAAESVDGEVVEEQEESQTDVECASTTSEDDEDKAERVLTSDRPSKLGAKTSEEKRTSNVFSHSTEQQPLLSPTSPLSPYQSSGRLQSPALSTTARSKPSPLLQRSYASPQYSEAVAAQLIASARSSAALSPNLTVMHRASPSPHSKSMRTPTRDQAGAAASSIASPAAASPAAAAATAAAAAITSPSSDDALLKAALRAFESHCLGGEEPGGPSGGGAKNAREARRTMTSSLSSPMNARSPQAVAAAEAWAAQQRRSEAVEKEVHLREMSEAEAAAEEARRQEAARRAKAEAEAKAAAEAAARAKEAAELEQQRMQEAQKKQEAEAHAKLEADQAQAQHAAAQQQQLALQAQQKAAAALQASKDPFVEAWWSTKRAAEAAARSWKMKLNARKSDASPTTVAFDIATKAAALVAAVPPAVDKHLDFFIVNEVVSKVSDLKQASADDFAKYALLLLQCSTVRPNLVPLALGAIADALSPDQSSTNVNSGQGCFLAPLRPSIPRKALRLLSNESQPYRELSALSACLMEPLASMLLNALRSEINQQQRSGGQVKPLPRMPPLPAAGTPAATPVVPAPTTLAQGSGGGGNRTANALRWLTKAVAALEREASTCDQAPSLVELIVEPFLRVSSCALWRCYGEAFEKQVVALNTRVLRPLASSTSTSAKTVTVVASLSHRLNAFLARAMDTHLPPMRGGGAATAAWGTPAAAACSVPLLLNFSDDAGASIRQQKWVWLGPEMLTSLELGSASRSNVAPDLGPTPRS